MNEKQTIIKNGRFILFYGKIGEGKTLAAVKLVKELAEKGNKVFTNIKLNEIKSLPFHKRSFLRYKDKVIFLDMIDFSPLTTSQQYTKFTNPDRIDKFFSNNNTLIVTMQDPQYLCPALKFRLNNAFECYMNRSRNILVLDSIRNKKYIIRDKEAYFRFYNTMEMPNWKKN